MGVLRGQQMTLKNLYNILFTEYPKIGFSPAIVTMACLVAFGAMVVYGGVTLGKAYFAHTPAVETGHS
jgi:hypothetical protein